MEDDLPSKYEVIVIGTGMTESIVAAAASRIGKRVLHLDGNDYYGGMWASFTFEALQKWLNECQSGKTLENSKESTSLICEKEKAVSIGNQFSTVFNIEEKWFIPEKLPSNCNFQSAKITQTEESPKENKDGEIESETTLKQNDKLWCQEKIKSLGRKFNMDLAPKLLFSRGTLVELLISSNISRYAEFRCVNRILTWLDNKLETVPCSRADVFATKNVSLIEKRQLMQLLTLCVEYKPECDEFKGFEDKTLKEYLENKKLTKNLMHYVLYAIAMSNDKTPCMIGVERTQRFLSSLGRYGNTPFLWPMYGTGELPQCFCRLCAVFGGVYHLKRAANSIVVSDNQCKAIISDGSRLDCDHLVLGVSDAPPEFLGAAPKAGLSRGIFIIDRSISTNDKESLTLLQFPIKGKEPITIIEAGPSTHVCPPGLYILHMTTRQVDNAFNDLKPAVDKLLHCDFADGTTTRIDTDTQSTQTPKEKDTTASNTKLNDQANILKPQLLYSLYFNCPETSEYDLSRNVPSNVHLCSGPDLEIDYEFAVKQAKTIFSSMYPNSEFLPRAPDPEELSLEVDEAAGPPFQGTEEPKEE
ncbi:rab proteins geranylgeranyltransferase component A 1 [Daktulosphaira vitifoliae]|uniref:rab proteins geranylgeranyltransferase component A 1 n=1 Tax=Daktulosphaira vitifoliae TaxID=58002 RepID=UPI0021AA96B4|nr:rab proteins geranylgeranyltransferase component A 1 [Daktulosphaira vitifoliae]